MTGEWTKQPPTTAGWYWRQFPHEPQPSIIRVLPGGEIATSAADGPITTAELALYYHIWFRSEPIEEPPPQSGNIWLCQGCNRRVTGAHQCPIEATEL